MATDTVEPTDGATRDRRRLILILSLAWAALLLLLLLVWPSLYRYPGDSGRFRVNRITGQAQVYDKKSEEWRPARRGRNGRGTGSPYDGRGPRSEGGDRGSEWWHDGEGSGSGSRGADGDRWWEPGEGGSEPPADGSPIGGSRGGGRSGGSGSPIGGSRSGGGSPIGGD